MFATSLKSIFYVLFLLFHSLLSLSTFADDLSDAYAKNDYQTVYKLAEPRAKSGDASAQYYLGMLLWRAYDHVVERDLKQAAYWLGKAAAQRDYKAMYMFALLYDWPDPKGLDDKKRASELFDQAFKTYYPAAKNGDADAQYWLSLLYEIGRGVEQNYKARGMWVTRAAEQGHQEAQYELGRMFFRGDIAAKENHATAALWYRRAAEQGHKNAQSMLADLYIEGDGVEEDYKQAAYWARLSAEQGDRRGMQIVADLHMRGKGVAKDETAAIYWVHRLAERREGRALKFLAEFFNFDLKEDDYTPELRAIVLKRLNSYTPPPPPQLASQSTATQRGLSGGTAPATSQLQLGKYYALLIAVDDYRSGKLKKLKEPRSDAIKLKAALSKYQFEKIDILENPNRGEIYRAFIQLQKTLKKDDSLLIFFAGHGYWDEARNQGYWFPRDADPEIPVDWLSNADIRDQVRAIQSRHILLISDACFSGGILLTRSGGNSSDKPVPELYRHKSRKAMTSGVLTQVPDHSVFLELLVQSLEKNQEQYLSALTLFASFRDSVTSNSPNLQLPQYGDIREAGDEGGDFIFALKR